MFVPEMPDPEFTHYLISRFNIRVKTYGPEPLDSSAIDPFYIQQRLKLFEDYCLPSVRSQVSKNFSWLIYFDVDTDPQLLNRVQQITGSEIPVLLIRVPDFEGMLSDLRERIRVLTTPYVLTTRLDNDDLISENFIAAVQRHFIKTDGLVINFTRGFEIDLNRHYIKKWNDRPKNQFITLMEKRGSEKALTIYGFPHYALPPDLPVLYDRNDYQWAYTRHGYNYSPQKINARPVFQMKRLRSFPFLYNGFSLSFTHTAMYTLQWFAKRTVRKIESGYRKVMRIDGSNQKKP
jgi:hypothetical protein